MTPGYFSASGGIGSAWGPPVPAHVPEATAHGPAPGQDVERWARMTAERVRTWVVGGMLAFPPWLDNYTEETPAHRRAYRQMFAEPVVHAATMANVYSVAELEVQTHPQDPEDPREQEAAEFVGHALRTVRGGVVGLVTALLTGALIDGWSLVEPVWEPITEGKYRGKWAWRAVKAKDVRHLTPLVDGFLNVVGIRSQAGLLGLRVFDPADFLVYRNLSLFESPRGLSDYRAAYRAWWIMATAWRLRALGLERWSQPSLKGTYTDEGQHRQALEAALASYQANTWLTVPLGCTVDAIDIANRGESDFKSAIADLREEMAIACSYATLTILTSAQTNPRGDSEVQKTTTQLKQWGLAANVGAVLTEQAAPPLTRLNYPGVPPCTVTLGAVDEGALSARLRNDTGLVKDLGLKLSRKESYRYYGRQQPAGPDDELGGPAAPPPKPPPGGNGAGNGAAGGPPAPPFAETFAEERGGEFKRGGGRVSGKGKSAPAAKGKGGGNGKSRGNFTGLLRDTKTGTPRYFVGGREVTAERFRKERRLDPKPRTERQPIAPAAAQSPDPTKSKFVGAAVGKAEHVHSQKVEQEVAGHVGGLWEPDNQPYDVIAPGHAVEVKSLLKGAKTSISVHDDALARKIDFSESHPDATFHTVAVDERQTYEGGAHAENFSGNRLYYRRGGGRYALSKMHPVGDAAELKRLISMPDDQLPPAARGGLPVDGEAERVRASARKAHASRLAKDRARKARLKAARAGQ